MGGRVKKDFGKVKILFIIRDDTLQHHVWKSERKFEKRKDATYGFFHSVKLVSQATRFTLLCCGSIAGYPAICDGC